MVTYFLKLVKYSVAFQRVKNQWVIWMTAHPVLEVSFWVVLLLSVYLRVFYALIPLVFLSFLARSWRFFVFGALFCLFMGKYLGPLPQEEKAMGKALFSFQEEGRQKGFFGPFWSYKGKLLSFEGSKKYRRLPIVCYTKQKIKGGLEEVHQEVALLKKREGYGYQLKLLPSTQRVSWPKKVKLASLRVHLKKSYKNWVQKKIAFSKASEFIIGITTGEFSNPFLSFTFSRLGLNHLLAISGFHFGLLVLFLNYLFHLCPSRLLKIALLILSTTLFAALLGFSPSLFRAWIMTSLYLVALFLRRPAKPLNLLACAFLGCVFIEPLIITHMGFQYSFLITYSILVYTPLFKKMKFLQPNNKALSWLGSMLALALSVNLMAIPITLYYFHKFYLLSFLANVLIPPLIALFLFLFCLLSLLSFLPVDILWNGLGKVIEVFLARIENFPTTWDYCLRVPCFPLGWLWLYGTLFFLFPAIKDVLSSPKDASVYQLSPLARA